MDSLLLFFTILSALVAFFTYLQKYVFAPEESKNRFLQNFKYGRKINEELIDELESYAEENNAFYTHVMQGLTFQQGINELKRARDLLFTEEHEQKIKNAKSSKEHIDSMNKQIKDQILYHTQIKNHFKWFIKEE